MHTVRRPSPPRRRIGIITAISAAVLLLATGCMSVDGEARAGDAAVAGFVTASLPDQEGDAATVKDQIPEGDSNGPSLSLDDADLTAVNGGSLRQDLNPSEDIKRVRVALEGSENGSPSGSPTNGYIEVTYGQATSSADLVLTLAQALPSPEFGIYLAGVTEDGVQGPLVRQAISALTVGTGQVQISASWDVDSDLDLAVVDPNGDVIYFGEKTSPAGGELDLDSNPACTIDGIRNENITFPDGAPAGEYKVYVNLYNSCDTDATNYVVTVSADGASTQTYSGELTGDGTRSGELNQMREVTTFEVT